MKTLIGGLLITGLAAVTMTANAADITVRGSPTCQAYLADRQKPDIAVAMKDLDWFLGYVSGLAVGLGVDVLAQGDPPDSMLKWVDLYCPRYPRDYLSEAGNMYVRFVKKAHHLK